MKSITIKLNNNQHGFTLLEMLFAVIIFSFALISLMMIAGKGVVATASARDQLTAGFLAEEGLEVVRNIRDSNYIDGADWTDGALNQCVDATCDVDYTQTRPSLVRCDGSCSGRILYDNQGTFRPDAGNGGKITTFWREITITSVSGVNGIADQVLVTSTVHWKQKNLNREFSVQTYMTDWR